jgi:uncharacterized protein YciI
MAYAILTQDKPNSAQLRAEVRGVHIEYLKTHQQMLIAAGGLLNDDGSAGPGGILLVDTDDRAVAERFLAEDPFTKAGLFEKTTVTRWRKAFFDGKCLL